MGIHARFSITQVNRTRGYYKDPGEDQSKSVEAAYVYLNAVQGEPFGPATPSGHNEMLIVNPDAAQQFFAVPLGAEFDVLLTVRQAESG